jgi:hypothetical protein
MAMVGWFDQGLIADLMVDRDSEPSHYLAELTQKFVDVCGARARRFETISYFERKPSSIIERSRGGNLVKLELLVTEESARRIDHRPGRSETLGTCR